MTTKSRAAAAAEASFDIFTAGISLADIACDIAVAVDFYQRGQLIYFWASVFIFGAAQAAYAFLFVAAFGRHRSNAYRTLCFVLALPFSQLVPVFTLLESLHLPAVSKLLRRVGLRPTVEDATATSDGDSLWALMQRKTQAHAGFLVEALVEAIPQCALQVSAVSS